MIDGEIQAGGCSYIGSIENKLSESACGTAGGRVGFDPTSCRKTVSATHARGSIQARRIDPPASLLASEASLHVQLVASIVVIRIRDLDDRPLPFLLRPLAALPPPETVVLWLKLGEREVSWREGTVDNQLLSSKSTRKVMHLPQGDALRRGLERRLGGSGPR